MKAFKAHLDDIGAYPYRKVDARIKLDQNESPEDLPAPLKERALERLRSLPWNRYPDLHAEGVRAAVARSQSWEEAGVVAAPGSNFLVLALAQAARQVVDTVPSFAYYEGAARLSGVPYRTVPLADRFACPTAALLAAMRDPPGVLFLANPHAPTGSLFPEGEVRRLADHAEASGWILVVDEAYHQFSGSDHRLLARANPSVVLLRTFSKAFGLGGLRAGYLLGAPEVASRVQGMLPPFCIPAHTAAVLEVVLEAPEYATALARRLVAERQRLVAALASHPSWRPFPSATNFVLVRTPDAGAAFDALLAREILVRRQDHVPGLAGCFRVSVGTPQENDAFVAAAFDAVGARPPQPG